MSKTSPGNCKCQVKVKSGIKKNKKRIPTRNNFIVVFASTFRGINSNVTWGNTGGDTCISSAMCYT